jgi:hypothetical protein
MSKMLSNLFRWIISLLILGFILYTAYLFTVYALLNAPKGVFIFGFISAILIMYFTIDSTRENGEKYYKDIKEIIISFLIYFLVISWISALAIDFLAGYNPSPCYDEFSCDEISDYPVP